MRDVFPTWYTSPLQPQSVIDLVIIDWAVKQIINLEYLRAFDWTARMYEGQMICKNEIEYGLPALEDRTGYVRNLRELLSSLGVIQQ